MPYSELYKRLKERTGGRILRGDGDADEEARLFKKSVFNLGHGPLVSAKDPLWVELTLKL
jgi:hypothetical protein